MNKVLKTVFVSVCVFISSLDSTDTLIRIAEGKFLCACVHTLNDLNVIAGI